MSTNNKVENNEIYYIISIINIFIKYWYVFAISIFICVGCAFFLNFTAEPVYQIKTTILIKDNNKNTNDPSKELLSTFLMFSPNNDFQNELLLLQSSSLIASAVKKAGFEITYYQKRGLKKSELYTASPFKVLIDAKHIQPVNLKFQIIPLNGNQFRIICEKSDKIWLYNFETYNIASSVSKISLDQTARYGDTIKGDNFKFRVISDASRLQKFKSNTKFYFWFNDLNGLVNYFQGSLSVVQTNTEVTAADISIKLNHPDKGIDFLNAYTEAYLQKNLDRKNFIATNTIKYIDHELSNIADSLNFTEKNLRNFRSSHQVMDMSSKANRIFDLTRDLENQKAELQARAKYYEYINDYLTNNREISDLMIPSAMEVNNEMLSKITQDLLNLSTEKNNLSKNKQDKSPYFNTLTIRIENLKNALSENIKYSINTNNLSISGVEERLAKLYGDINQLPETERQLFGIERKFKLNDNTYTFLLEKRAEAQIAKASNLPDNEIVEAAKMKPEVPISPNKRLNLIISILAGLFFPFCYFWVKQALDETVSDEKTLKDISKLPSIGNVYHNIDPDQKLVLIDLPQSQISESLRTVRTNLDYFLQGKRQQVILFTSTTSGEGKSFIALNIAISLALLERKTILVDFDFRKPKLFEFLGMANTPGATSYLINKANLQDIIIPTGIKNLDFITAGPIPPNPVELIGSEKTDQLINHLKSKYDYIIIDTPPSGLVSEALVLMKYSDLKIFVVRLNHTPKKQFANLLEEMDAKNINNMCLLLNDNPVKRNSY
jgi:capsular exopolysaccharide synthesis family protein